MQTADLAARIRIFASHLTESLDSLDNLDSGQRLHDAEHVLNAAEGIRAAARMMVREVREELGLDD